MAKIAVVGSSNTDMVIRVPHIPGAGETVLGDELIIAAGGKGANQAVAAARLGAEVALVARVGRDMFGEEAIAGFVKERLITQHVSVDPQTASGVALIAVDPTGENSISVAPGANMRLTPDMIASARPAIEAADVLLLQLEVPLDTVLTAARIAHNAGVRVILNPAPALKRPLPAELWEHVDVLTPNESEFNALNMDVTDPNPSVQALLENGIEAIVVTLGARGALLITQEEEQLVPSLAVKAVDTTAAGDAFNGGLAVALADGRPLLKAVQFANVCGALAATKLGAQPSLPTLEEVQAFLQTFV